MAGCDKSGANGICIVKKCLEFYEQVAFNAGIRRFTAQVSVKKRFDDSCTETFAGIGNSKGDAERLCGGLCALGGFAGIVQIKRKNFKSGFLQQDSGCGAIDATGQAQDYTGHWGNPPSSVIWPAWGKCAGFPQYSTVFSVCKGKYTGSQYAAKISVTRRKE